MDAKVKISCSENFDYQNILEIENITRTWFHLMVTLNESPLIRNYFSTEKYNKDKGEWIVKPTEYTRLFLTSGIAIYGVYEAKNESNEHRNMVDTIILTEETESAAFDDIKKYNKDEKYDVVAIIRWPGCGMKIPKDVEIILDANITWPILTCQMKDSGKTKYVLICNTPNKIHWLESEEEINWRVAQELYDKKDSENMKSITSNNKTEQGMTKGSLSVPGELIKDKNGNNAKLRLPYTCPSFDILTEISLGDYGDEIVVFTT